MDTLRDAGYALLGLALFCGLLQQRAEQAVRRDLSRHVPGARFRVQVEPRGWFGLAVGQSSVTRVSGSRFSLDRPPFVLLEGGGLDAHIRTLRIDLEEVEFAGLRVRSFRAEIPRVRFDGWRALAEERIVIRRAGVGRVEIQITEQAIEAYLARRFPQFPDLRLRLRSGKATVSTRIPALGNIPFVAQAGLALEGGRVHLENPEVELAGRALPAAEAQSLLAGLQTVLDIEEDLGLGGFVKLDSVEIRTGLLVARGEATIPAASSRGGQK